MLVDEGATPACILENWVEVAMVRLSLFGSQERLEELKEKRNIETRGFDTMIVCIKKDIVFSFLYWRITFYIGIYTLIKVWPINKLKQTSNCYHTSWVILELFESFGTVVIFVPGTGWCLSVAASSAWSAG